MFTLPAIDTIGTGMRIMDLRKKAGLSVKDLQNIFGFATPNAIYKWQNGAAMPTLDNLIVLAAVFNVSLDEIIVTDNKLGMQIGAWDKVDSEKWVQTRSPSLKARTQGFQPCNARFDSGGDHLWVGKSSGEDGGL